MRYHPESNTILSERVPVSLARWARMVGETDVPLSTVATALQRNLPPDRLDALRRELGGNAAAPSSGNGLSGFVTGLELLQLILSGLYWYAAGRRDDA